MKESATFIVGVYKKSLGGQLVLKKHHVPDGVSAKQF